MHRTFLIFLVFATTLSTSCTTVEKKEASYEVGSYPETGVEMSASVGEVMVTEYDYLARKVAKVRRSVDGSIWRGRDAISQGTALIGAIAGDKTVYCQPPGGEGSPCLHDSNDDGSFDEAYTMNELGMVGGGSDIDPVPYRVEDSTIQDGFKYELVYQGIDENVVRIAYREYTDNLARPAYRQDLSYTLDEGETPVTFRDVQLEIHEATNNEIVYTVQSGF